MRANESRLNPRRTGAAPFENAHGATRGSARPHPIAQDLLLLICIGLTGWTLACGAAGGGSVADTGGVSGTGISQGSISAFGSIFVNGVEWNLTGATVTIDGAPAAESDLRLGMVVRVEGGFGDDGLTGNALSVDFNTELEGPIASAPVTIPGIPTQKMFSVLGRTILVDENGTAFNDGASFAGLATDQVIRLSGFVDGMDTLHATLVELVGSFPDSNEIELRGTVSNLVSNPDGTGLFDLGPILVHFDPTTSFSDVTPQTLANDDPVEVEGVLRLTGDELDAVQIELDDDGLGDDDFEKVKIEGFVTGFVSLADFRVAGIPTDASSAILDPPTGVIANGRLVEVEGPFENGVLIANGVEFEDEDGDSQEEVQIEATVSSVDPGTRTITILGIRVETDGRTRLEDDRDDRPNFRFEDIQPGDWLEIEGVRIGPSTALADSIERDEDGDDVFLEGPVTALDPGTPPSLFVVGQPIPLSPSTLYFDAQGDPRSQAAFFQGPGGVVLGAKVSVIDFGADDPSVLGEADEVAISSD